MAFSYVTSSGDGITKSFTFSFEGQDEGYIRKEDIIAEVNGVPNSFTLTSSNVLEFAIAPPVGDGNILIRRVMPKSVPYADFQRGNNFGQEVLNNSFLQLLYVVHELLDGWFPNNFVARRLATFAEGLVSNKPDPDNPDSVVTFSSGDDRYVNRDGDSIFGSIDMQENPLYVRKPEFPDEPSRKSDLDKEISDRASADSKIQSQLSGNSELEASAFSPISWHDQEVSVSVGIPDNKNAWSFGPVVTVGSGQVISVGQGSYWTIANGEVQ